MEANGGTTFRPAARLSLDAKKSLNTKPVAKALSPSVPTKKPSRKSLPKLPSEKTKLSLDSQDRKEGLPVETTITSNETNELETQAHAVLQQERDSNADELSAK